MDKADIPFLSVSQLSELIKSRQVSPVEVVEGYLERIDRLNDRLYAYLTVCRDQAVEAARASERELARGEYRGPLHGVPVAVKDQLNTAGIRTTCGTPIFNDCVPDEDATVIAKLKSAGAILLGKLNMTEFGTTSLSHAFDTARNPWDLERFTGGSSSGSGGATAAFMCATSLGEDTGGSVRGPPPGAGWWVSGPPGAASAGMASGPACGPWTPSVPSLERWKTAPSPFRPSPVTIPTTPTRGMFPCPTIGPLWTVTWRAKGGRGQGAAVRRCGGARGARRRVPGGQVLAELGAQVEEVSIPLTRHANTISSVLRVEAPPTIGS